MCSLCFSEGKKKKKELCFSCSSCFSKQKIVFKNSEQTSPILCFSDHNVSFRRMILLFHMQSLRLQCKSQINVMCIALEWWHWK